VKRGEAITRIKAAGRARDVLIRGHPLTELENDGKDVEDLFSAMRDVQHAVEQRGGTWAVDKEYSWKCRGPDTEDKPLGFVVKIKERVIVVTAWAETAPRKGG
jgi:hypothetical protein